MKTTRFAAIVICLALICTIFAGCGEKKETILIYTSAEDYIVESLQEKLDEKFPEYDVIVEYSSTGDMAAKLINEGKNTECDIVYSLEYPYIQKLDAAGGLADISKIVDISVFSEDSIFSDNFVPVCRTGGAVVVNTEVLKQKKLSEPTCYEDLLEPKYKDLVSMPNPKSSGTGYMFLLSRINALGEEKAFEYFDKLSENVFQFTSSGSGPINALLQGEAAIGFGMTGNAVVKINDENAPFKLLFFDEGSPFSFYGQSIVAGKEEKAGVKEVFTYLATDYAEVMCGEFYPERIFKDKTYTLENHPTDIQYADMSGNTSEYKEELLKKWKY